jgi:hypothetical protein
MASVTWTYSNGLSPSGAGRNELAAMLNQYKQSLRMNRNKAAVEAMLSSLPQVNKGRSAGREKEKNTVFSDLAIYQLVPKRLTRRYVELMTKLDAGKTAGSSSPSAILKDLLSDQSQGRDKQAGQSILNTQLDVLA